MDDEDETSTRPSKFVQFATFEFSDPYAGYDDEESILDQDQSTYSETESEHRSEVSYDPDAEHHSFTPLMTNVYINVLADCQDQLDIINKINKLPPTDVNLEYIPLKEKYATFDCEDDILFTEWWHLNIKKLSRDITFVTKTLQQTIDNLLKNSTYSILLKIIQNFEMTRDERQTVLDSRPANKKDLKRLRITLEVERQKYQKEINRIMEYVGFFKDQYNDCLVECSSQTNFLARWESSRQEQNSMVLKRRENKLTEITNQYLIENEKEKRVHDEVIFYLENSKTEMEDEILKWMDKYDQEIDNREVEINRMKGAIENLKDEHVALQNMYKQHQREIEDYKEHKRIKKLQEEEQERRTNAAVRIQAWWRGTMYRKRLGPYRKKKGGKKTDSGNKKKTK